MSSFQYWFRQHPLKLLFAVFILLPLFGFFCAWAYAKAVIPGQVVKDLHAAGLPATPAELTLWERADPAQDGGELIKQAVADYQALLPTLPTEIVEALFGVTPLRDAKGEALDVFVARPEECRKVFAALQPVFDLVVEASQKPTITTDYNFLAPCDGQTAFVFGTKIHRLLLLEVQQLLQAGNPEQRAGPRLMTMMRSGLALNDSGRLVVLIGDGVLSGACSSVAANLPAFTPQQLRQFSALLLSAQTDERMHNQLRRGIAYEAVESNYFSTLLRELGSEGFCKRCGYEPATIFPVQCALFTEFENREKINVILDVYALGRTTYAAEMPEAERITNQWSTRRSPWRISAWYPLIDFIRCLCGSCPPRALFDIQNFYNRHASVRLTGIACELAARLQEGQPLPTDLNAFPVDPITGKPFELIRRDTELVLRSPGLDLAFSSPPLPGERGLLDDKAMSRAFSKTYSDDRILVIPLPLTKPAATPATAAIAAPASEAASTAASSPPQTESASKTDSSRP